MPGGGARLRNGGASYGSAWCRCGNALLGNARCVTAERNGADVLADERVSFSALVQADLAPPKPWQPDLIRRSQNVCFTLTRLRVMAGLVPAIHVLARCNLVRGWMSETSLDKPGHDESRQSAIVPLYFSQTQDDALRNFLTNRPPGKSKGGSASQCPALNKKIFRYRAS
jgi:hypothetical protein